MSVDLELSLEQRLQDRVRVLVALSPVEEDPAVEGVTLQLVDGCDRELCARVLLPIAGRLHGPVSMSVELRAGEPLARGCRIVASGWSGTSPLHATCPADPIAGLSTHVLGALPEDAPTFDAEDILLEPLDDQERQNLTSHFPFLARPVRERADAMVIEGEPTADDVIGGLGLDGDAADLLREILGAD